MNTKKIVKIAICLISSIIFADYITYFIEIGTPLKYIDKVVIFIFYSILGALIFDKIFKRNFLSKILNNNKKVFLIIITCIIATILTVFAGKNILIGQKVESKKISIIALNEKNLLAKANEVWIVDIKENGQIKDLNTIKLNEGWEFKENAILSYQNQPTQLDFFINVGKEENAITFVKHQYSGKIKIIEDQKETEIDLYSQEGNQYTYQVKQPIENINFLRVLQISFLIFIGYIVIIYKWAHKIKIFNK